MSHVATVDLEIRDLDALAEAATRLGMELARGQQTYRCWYTATPPADRDEYLRITHQTVESLVPEGFRGDEIGRCEHALRVRGNGTAYELGVARRRDGRPGYVLLFEEYGANSAGKALLDAVGPGCRHLKREYAYAVARKTAVAQGFTVNEQRQPDGSIRLRLTR